MIIDYCVLEIVAPDQHKACRVEIYTYSCTYTRADKPRTLAYCSGTSRAGADSQFFFFFFHSPTGKHMDNKKKRGKGQSTVSSSAVHDIF